jgi:hypothetical protein
MQLLLSRITEGTPCLERQAEAARPDGPSTYNNRPINPHTSLVLPFSLCTSISFFFTSPFFLILFIFYFNKDILVTLHPKTMLFLVFHQFSWFQ